MQKQLSLHVTQQTAMALNSLKNEFKDIPIIGVIEPGSEKAISETNQKKIGVIGTIATISSRCL